MANIERKDDDLKHENDKLKKRIEILLQEKEEL